MRTPLFTLILLAIAAALYLAFRVIGNDYLFFLGYVVLQLLRFILQAGRARDHE